MMKDLVSYRFERKLISQVLKILRRVDGARVIHDWDYFKINYEMKQARRESITISAAAWLYEIYLSEVSLNHASSAGRLSKLYSFLTFLD